MLRAPPSRNRPLRRAELGTRLRLRHRFQNPPHTLLIQAAAWPREQRFAALAGLGLASEAAERIHDERLSLESQLSVRKRRRMAIQVGERFARIRRQSLSALFQEGSLAFK